MASKTDFGNVSSSKIRRLVLTHLEELDTPRSLSIFLLLKAGEDSEVPKLIVDPLWFNDEYSYREFAIPTSFVKKWVGLKVNVDPSQVAKEKFLACEVQCRLTNRRIRCDAPLERVERILSRTRKIIASVLPSITTDFLDHLGDLGGWGKGVTSSCKGGWLSPYNKIGAVPQSTPAFSRVAVAFLKETPLWFNIHQKVEVIPGNTVSFVPKTAVTDRPIAVEPSMNAFFQKAVGKALRPSLKKLGVHLESQDRNRLFAKEAAKTGSLATVDLESASDTIAKSLVEYLFPKEWVSLLGLLRSEHFFLDGTWSRYEKWSSMGNGYTFELESLIFSALCLAITRDHSKYAVYGDDIIVPVSVYDTLAECLEWCGFTINKNKTFSSGPFRESCGEDFFLDSPVRPFYLKDETVVSLYIWGNALRSSRAYRGFPIRKTWLSIKKAIPNVLMGPKGNHGLLLLECNYEDCHPDYSLYRRPYGPWFGYSLYGWRWLPLTLNRRHVDGAAAVIASWWMLRSNSPETGALSVSKSGHGRWVRKRAIQSEWPELRDI